MGEYVLKPIVAAQQSIFDTDYKAADAEEPDESSASEDGAIPSLPAHVEETPAPPPEKKADRPFSYLRRYIGQKLRVFEALENYTVRAIERGNGLHSVVLSSAFNPTDAFYCPAEKLKPHLGHELVCGGDDEHGEECYADDGGQIFKAFVVCADCGEVLFHLNADGDNEEPEDVSDVFDSYPYEEGATE